MTDLNVRMYNHGGGTIEYTGQTVIEPGAFKFRSPCPPGGSHTYQWTAYAKDESKKKLGTARAKTSYP